MQTSNHIIFKRRRTLSYRIDHDESIQCLVTRLKEEHREIHRRLNRISEISQTRDGNLRVAISLLEAIRPVILRHAVEEEAQLARAIMGSSKTRKRSEQSVKILQEDRRIKEFYDELPYLLEENAQNRVRKNILEFVDMVRKHHAEEEKETFPLALVA